MHKPCNVNRLSILAAIMLSGLSTTFGASAEIAVIVNTANNTTLEKADIEKIFTGRMKSYPDGNVAIPMNAAKNMSTRDEFNQSVLGRTSSQVNAYWSKLVFTGKGNMPMELASDAEIISTISSNKGAIGYVSVSSVTDDVKVIAKF
ncbi:phosphate ABC transporter substrate-binding protein [Pseudoalteromonas tunicata]|uniref:ABC-type phosphate transport system, periplasmic component n=1 Tax=Pseudoalteromonas tunicata D2 TaxID=87626 RepID=A4C5D1_9GAMM|nr:phosphate ABC transporter substrate-binding protein [Pseudoalteromonas tunicata]EAR30763.1 hypothetical protein PTD2_04301 [Pseudoalteromonas tunicata D2]MDP5214702.1 phosphate ABC transporter substrate-binding protein [Pseudoalteromonas tunicata]